MTEKPTRRRRRILLVLLVCLGVAAWVSRLVERRTLQDGWQPLPPRPVHPAPVESAASAEPAAEPVPIRARAVPVAAAVASVTAPVSAPVPAPVSAPALQDAPFGPGSARAGDDGASPEAGYVVKGKTATRVFYAPGSPYYSRTRADVWFRTDDDARAAGFTARAPRGSG